MGAPVARASSTGPGFATNRGPRGPSMVNATAQPCSSSLRMPSSARTAPRLLDPRTFTKPNLRIMRPVHSPSKLSLLITLICRSRQMYVAGKMQLCQNARTIGRTSSDPGAPSSNETPTLSVGPISRIARNPPQVISQSKNLCHRLYVRPCVDDSFATGDVVAALTPSLYRPIRKGGDLGRYRTAFRDWAVQSQDYGLLPAHVVNWQKRTG
jgi:hypothetical protein